MRQVAAYGLGVVAMGAIAYGCWMANEALGFVVGGVLTMSLAVELKGRKR